MKGKTVTTTDTAPADTARFCPRGCATADHCKGSIAIPCARNLWDLGETGRFQPCGCLERSRCEDGCMCCLNCDGCYCGEE